MMLFVLLQYIDSKLSDTTPVFDTALLCENILLNRDQQVLPDDKYRVILKSAADKQSYINAVRVNVSLLFIKPVPVFC